MTNLTNRDQNSINVNGVHVLLWDKQMVEKQSPAGTRERPNFQIHFFAALRPFLRNEIMIGNSQQNFSYDRQSLTSVVLNYDSAKAFTSENISFETGQTQHQMMVEDLAINGHVAARVDII